MRIISGRFRGRKLNCPIDEETRPTSDRARESLFNLIENHLRRNGISWGQIVFADVFAGTGAVGVEALSRGAKQAIFVEKHPAAQKVIRQNVVGFDGVVLETDALKARARTVVDIVFMDPPYQKGLCEAAMAALCRAGWIGAETLVICEVDKNESVIIPEGLEVLDTRSYGRNTFIFLKAV